jgi:hypothetical protein
MEQTAKLPQLIRGDEWDASRRPKSSQDVVETSLPVLVPSIGMGSTMETDTRIGDGKRAVSPAGGDAATRTPAVRCAVGRLQRVRACMRVTRSAKGLPDCERVTPGCSGRARHRGRRGSVRLLSDAGGPGPLTEDCQKPSRRWCEAHTLRRPPRSDGMHGTRNTVPSIAANRH